MAAAFKKAATDSLELLGAADSSGGLGRGDMSRPLVEEFIALLLPLSMPPLVFNDDDKEDDIALGAPMPCTGAQPEPSTGPSDKTFVLLLLLLVFSSFSLTLTAVVVFTEEEEEDDIIASAPAFGFV